MAGFQFRRRKPTTFRKSTRGVPTLRDHHAVVTQGFSANVLVDRDLFFGPFDPGTAIDEVVVVCSAAVKATWFEVDVGDFPERHAETGSGLFDSNTFRKLAATGASNMRVYLNGTVADGSYNGVFPIPIYHRIWSGCPFLGVQIRTSDDVYGWVGLKSVLEP